MKKLLLIYIWLLSNQCIAQNTWLQKANFGGVARGENPPSFSIGSKGYVGTGYRGTYLKDFWEYNPATNSWTQKADFGGTARSGAVGFSIGSKGYIGTGDDINLRKDFWEYDPSANTWIQKADFGGSARSDATGFSIGSKGYIGTGSNLKDFWEYDPATNSWVQKANFGGSARGGAKSFGIGLKGYLGMGSETINFVTTSKIDFWAYDPSTNTWIRKADFGGSARGGATSFSIGSKGYLGTGYYNSIAYKDFWEYNPSTNSWVQKADFGGTARDGSFGFSIGTKGYIGAGQDVNFRNDFWEYSPTSPTIWLGVTNVWSDAANWNNGIVPGIGSDVVLPSGLAIYPTVYTSTEIKSLSLQSGATLTIAANIELKINGQ